MRKHGRTDANQKRIVNELRSLGYSVSIIASLGHGIPDLIVGKFGKNLLVELKDGDKPLSAQRLTPDEIKFSLTWKGAYMVSTTSEKIIEWFEH